MSHHHPHTGPKGFNTKDIRILIAIWVIGVLMAVVTAWLTLRLANPEGIQATRETPTTHWLTAPATPLAEAVRVNWAFTTAIIFPFLFAPILTLIYSMVRFAKDKNPTPGTVHENVPLEVFWTVIPAIVLVVMAFPSYRLLKYLENAPGKPDIVVDVVGAQFYWQYNFPRYDVTMVDDGSGDAPVYLPVNKITLLNGTSTQVNHAWWVPAFGLKFDVIPGRINTGWVKPKREGYYKGQCAELCGALHAFMWIHVKVVSEAEFYKWILDHEGRIPADEVERVKQLLPPEVIEKHIERLTVDAPAVPKTQLAAL